MSYEIQRVYDYKGETPALFIDRLWPRGIKKERLANAIWMKDITPSATLREWFHQDIESRYSTFCKLYLEELAQPEKQADILKIKQLAHDNAKVILLTAVKHPQTSHVPVLLSVLKQD